MDSRRVPGEAAQEERGVPGEEQADVPGVRDFRSEYAHMLTATTLKGLACPECGIVRDLRLHVPGPHSSTQFYPHVVCGCGATTEADTVGALIDKLRRAP